MIVPQFFSPCEITGVDIRVICALKNQSWPHSMESQLAWWEKNTAADDQLVTLAREGSIMAFLRLRSRSVSVNGARLNALCATEVCVEKSQRGQGLGARLMNLAVARIKQTNSALGYLLCRDIQEPFYAKCGWRRTDTPIQIESPAGARRLLAENERCMTVDPHHRLNGQVVVFGDVF
jgi:predicted N-acetyltransferase YhbS